MSSNIHFLEKHKDTTSYIFDLVDDFQRTAQISKTCQEITKKLLALYKIDYEQKDLIKPYIHKALETCQTDAEITKVVYELILKEARVVLDRLQIKQSAIDAGSKLSTSRLVRLVEAVNAAKPQLAKDTIVLFNAIANQCPKAIEFLDSQPQQNEIALANAITDWMKKAPEDTFAEITSLFLSRTELYYLSPIIGKLTNLTELGLSNNILRTLPTDIGKLTNLTYLNLSGNILQTLPIDICKLTNLTSLGLSRNILQTLPKEIGKLTNLTWLDLSSNKLKTLPTDIGKLTNLTLLDLGNNILRTLPTDIGKLTNLIRLSLEKNNLKTLPAEIGKLKNLEELNLSDNTNLVLPSEINQLTHTKITK